jgi:hypothetical protein
MQQCEFCGTILPEEASFCGKCGRVPSRIAHQLTQIGDASTVLLENVVDENAPTMLLSQNPPLSTNSPSGSLHPITLVPIDDEDDEDDEELRRRAALLGFGVPLLGAATMQPPGQMPVMSGTPHMASIPTLPNTPGPLGPSSPAAPSWLTLQQPGNMPPPSTPNPLPPHPGHPGTGGTTGGASGCLTIGAIIAAAALLILSTIIGLGLTVFAPQITLTGNTSVIQGNSITLHGSSFLPNNSVTLTHDNNIPLYVARPSLSAPLASNSIQTGASTALFIDSSLAVNTTNVISTNGSGDFSLALQIDSSWTAGQHTIHATEAISHRSASLVFTVQQPGTTPTPVPTGTPTPIPTPTDTPTATPTTPPTPAPTLTCATPGNLALGPVSEGSTQPATGSVTLCTNGSGTLTWQARWDQTKAPWLQLPQSSGTVQAPNQARVTINAVAGNLTAGTYSATITFIGVESNTTQAVHVSFTVQAGCVKATPPRMIFVGAEGVSDPASQTITVTNCGLASNWSAKASTKDGGNWLTVKPTQGSLKANATGTATVTVSNVEAVLKAGSYQGSITITIGSQSVSISVVLTVQPAISASPTSLSAYTTPCTSNANGSASCTVTLTNNSSSKTITWSYSGSPSGVTVDPASGFTIQAGGSEQVTLVFTTCTNSSVTFVVTGATPASSSSVSWACQIIG